MNVKKIITPVILVAILAILFQGCNTIHGAGKDIEKAGQTIEDAAK